MDKDSILDSLKGVLDNDKVKEAVKDAGEAVEKVVDAVKDSDIVEKIKSVDMDDLKDAGKELLSHLGEKKDEPTDGEAK